jgi:PAS domain-containing protein
MLDLARPNDAPFLAGGGDMGAQMRRFDWCTTPIGAPEGWPAALRLALRLLLNTNHPMLIWWGPDLIQFYNDNFRQMVEPDLRTDGLGKSGHKYWCEIWEIIRPDVEQVMRGNGGIWRQHCLMPTNQPDGSNHHYWTYSFSPIEDEAGIGGILVICRDETQEHRANHALRAREAELARVQQIGKIGGLEVNLTWFPKPTVAGISSYTWPATRIRARDA